jgi:hypothetical protein
MHHQAVGDVFEPNPRFEYSRQHAKLRAKRPPRVTTPRAPKPTRPSPLPSVRAIDAALEAKYGAVRYLEP